MKKFIVLVTVLALIIGFIYGFQKNIDLSSIIFYSASKPLMFFSLIILVGSLFLTFLGLPVFLLILLFEAFLMGAVISIFICNYFFKGLIFIIIFLLLFKFFTFFVLFLNSFYALKFIKNFYAYLFKKSSRCKNNAHLYLKKILIISLASFFYSFLMLIFGDFFVRELSNYLLF